MRVYALDFRTLVMTEEPSECGKPRFITYITGSGAGEIYNKGIFSRCNVTRKYQLPKTSHRNEKVFVLSSDLGLNSRSDAY